MGHHEAPGAQGQERPLDRHDLVAVLRAGGCVAPDEEAAELLRAFGDEPARLGGAVARRLQGEPLAWVCGTAEFGGLRLHVEPGVYVPRRWQTPAVARRAAALLPTGGTAVDVCTGVGAVAALLRRGDPTARVLGTETDPVAIRCARWNGVEVVEGSRFAPLPEELAGRVDVVVAVAPYVPTGCLPLLPRDTLAHEPLAALDGGPDGLAVIRRIVRDATTWLRPGGAVVLEHGPDQSAAVARLLHGAGFGELEPVVDPDGDPCGTSARRV